MIRSLVVIDLKWFFIISALIFANSMVFKSKYMRCLLFLAVGFIFGFLRVNFDLSKMDAFEKEFNFSGTIVVDGPVESTEDYQKIKGIFFHKDKKMGVIVFAPTKPTIKYNNKLEVSCLMQRPENRHEKFNYSRFLASQKIYYICKSVKFKGIYLKKELTFKDRLFALRALFEKRIEILFPKTEGAYLAGLLLGGDNRLSRKVSEDFRVTGTTHTVAVSGYNITIISSVLMWIAVGLGLWRRQAFYLALLGIVLFVLLIGAPSSATRAAVMGILILLAMQKGRLADSVEVAIFAAVGMVLFSPLILIYDVGFQLSFLATLGIILVYAPLSILFGIEHDFLELKSIVLVTISAQLGVLGLLVYVFESFSLISVLANLFILPLIPIIMLAGFISIAFWFIPVFSQLAITFTWFLLHFEIFAISYLAKIPFASIDFGDLGILWLLGYYIFFVGFVFKLKQIEIKK